MRGLEGPGWTLGPRADQQAALASWHFDLDILLHYRFFYWCLFFNAPSLPMCFFVVVVVVVVVVF